jgi:hypothetical protein
VISPAIFPPLFSCRAPHEAVCHITQPEKPRVLILTTALACLCAGAVPPSEPNKGRSHHVAAARDAAHDSVAIPPPATKTGCAEFDVRLGAQSITVTPIAGSACGSIQVAIAGLPAFDTARRVLQLRVALHNTEILQLHPPAAVLARPGSLAITAGMPAGGALRFAAVDSIAGDSLRAGRPDARWVFDQSLGARSAPPVVASDGAIVVPPGGMSGPRTVGVAVPRAVTGFRVTLYGTGTNVFTVPAAAPDEVPLEEQEDSRAPDNIVTNDPRLPGRLVRNKLWLLFRDSASEEQRQAAVDLVQGVVIGGRQFGPSPYYYLRIPANPDSGGGPLAAVIRILATLPQVQHVMPDFVQGPAVPR